MKLQINEASDPVNAAIRLVTPGKTPMKQSAFIIDFILKPLIFLRCDA